MKKSNLIFMGTPDIAVPTLLKLNEIYNIQAVVTNPDKPKGRGLKLLPSAVKEAALQLNLPILQPEKMSDTDFANKISNLSPDIIIVFAFRILPPGVFNAAKIATFNIHTSLLPAYRGAAPINWAIINGDRITGLTTFILQDEIDAGDIILQKKIEISQNFTAGDLSEKMALEAPSLAAETCKMLLSGDYLSIKQNSNLASVAPKIFRTNAEINFNFEAEKVTNFINGYSPLPCAWTKWNNKIVKIFRAASFNELPPNIACDNFIYDKLEVGSFFVDKTNIFVKCLADFVQILELQLEGKKRMPARDFLLGWRN